MWMLREAFMLLGTRVERRTGGARSEAAGGPNGPPACAPSCSAFRGTWPTQDRHSAESRQIAVRSTLAGGALAVTGCLGLYGPMSYVDLRDAAAPAGPRR